MLCVSCPPPPGGRQEYLNRQKARAAFAANTAKTSYDWREDSNRAYRAAADAQQSMDDAQRHLDEIERSIEELNKRAKRSSSGL